MDEPIGETEKRTLIPLMIFAMKRTSNCICMDRKQEDGSYEIRKIQLKTITQCGRIVPLRTISIFILR